MRPTTPSGMGIWLKEKWHEAGWMEKILCPIFWVLAILSLGMLYSIPILQDLGKLPKP